MRGQRGAISSQLFALRHKLVYKDGESTVSFLHGDLGD